jgi:predicted choloylglycine hydrolase
MSQRAKGFVLMVVGRGGNVYQRQCRKHSNSNERELTMKLQSCLLTNISARGLALALAYFCFIAIPVRACTIFVLTDTNHALFCNNEDWSDPKTRIWFLPAGEGYYGATYVGFENGYAQGGMNTEGLAFDWVAGYTEKWELDPKLPEVRYNSGQRMLETCATIDEAIAFFRSHSEAGFWRAKILVADRSGASVIIGARDGQLQVESENQCRGFGYGSRPLNAALAKNPKATIADGFKILSDCRQSGDYSTKYSNIFDLKSGDIFLGSRLVKRVNFELF